MKKLNMNRCLSTFLAACMSAAVSLPLCSTPFIADATGTYICGDVDADGRVSMLDVVNLGKYLAGKVELVDYSRADTNADCIVDVIDETILNKYVVNNISSLPYIAYGGGSQYANVGAQSVNEVASYTVFDAQTGQRKSSYTLGANPVVDNSRGIIGIDSRYGDDSLSGVVKILVKDTTSNSYGWGSGFVVDEHTIATAAHCVYNHSQPTFQNSKAKIESILIFNNVGNIEQVIDSSYEVHVPDTYISRRINRSEYRGYDYAMITVTDSLSSYANFNLGVMTDGMMYDSELLYCTGFPHYVKSGNTYNFVNNVDVPSNPYDPENKHNKFTGTGTIINDNLSSLNGAGLPVARTFYHNIDSGEGNSGGPIYKKITVGNTTYYTVVGILTGGTYDSTEGNGYNYATQMTTELLHFYKNNPIIEWE